MNVKQFISNLGLQDWIDESGTVDYRLFVWPPDTFAATASLLRHTGGYVHVTRAHSETSIPPEFELDAWIRLVEKVGDEWSHIASDTGDQEPPEEVRRALDEMGKYALLSIDELSTPKADNWRWFPFYKAMAFADRASRGVGNVVEPLKKEADRLSGSFVTSSGMSMLTSQIRKLRDEEADDSYHPMTLCKEIDPRQAVVLPKMRTSQRGVTIRSCSLYLSLLPGTDVEPYWFPPNHTSSPKSVFTKNERTPPKKAETAISPEELKTRSGPFNILLCPWPFDIYGRQFVPLDPKFPTLGRRPSGQDQLFAFNPDTDKLPERIIKAISERKEQAMKQVDHIHALVLPELALDEKTYEKVFRTQFEEIDFIACGVKGEPDEISALASNYTAIRYRSSRDKLAHTRQEKHHRWALDGPQVGTYQLASVLRPGVTWWEGIGLPRRSLKFFGIDSMLTCTVLVCEDLARPDPVADIIRSVGPNLVIGLLMDGPQLSTRWSARYSTVLADDPGSSVLTLSSLGMVRRSRVLDRLQEESRCIALWREPGRPPVELSVDPNRDSLLLTLYVSCEEEKTLDGRSDNGLATVLRLCAVHQLGGSE